MRALVIDDSKFMRVTLAKALRAAGFDVAEAIHGREALDRLAAQGPFDVALVDWNMPEMNGLEFVQAVRASASYAALKLMMVTSESEIARVEAALAAGADEYVMKPFTTDALREKLEMLGLEVAS